MSARVVLLFAMLVAGLCPAHALATETGASCPLFPSPSCGAQVLQRAFEGLGLADENRTARAINRLASKALRQKGLNSLYEIKRAAEGAGLHARALTVTLDGLRNLLQDGQVIANVTGNMHFCLITRVDDLGVTIYDPGLNVPSPTFPMPIFQEAWDGRILLVSRQPLDPEGYRGQATPLSDRILRTIVGGQPCYNCTGGGGTYTGTGGSGRWSAGNGPDPHSSDTSTARSPADTQEPVQIRNGNLFLDVTDLTVPTRGVPLEFSRHYNAQTTSEVWGWLPERGAGTWVVENGEYSGQGNRSTSELIAQDLTVTLDMQTIQPGTNTWEVGWINIRYTDSPANPRNAYHGYYFLIHTDGKLELSGWKNGAQRFLYNKPSSYRPTNKNRITVQAQGPTIKVSVNGSLEVNYTDASPVLSAGRIALEANFSHVHFDNVSITTGTSTTSDDFSSDDNDWGLGHGWTYTYSMRIREYPNHVTLIRENNAREIYVPQTDGSYKPAPTDTYTTLTKDTAGFSVRTKHGLHYRFDLTGRLQYLEDRNLNRTPLTYGTIGGKTVLTAVTEPAGRSLSLQYDTNNRLSTVSDPAGNQITYSYDAAGHLNAVRDRLGHEERYAYDPITHNLTQLTDKAGNRYQYTYTYNDRVNDQVDPLGNRTTFDYLWNTVHVINKRNELTRYNFDNNGFLQSVSDPANVMERTDNDASGNITNHYDKNGVKTYFTYDTKGNRTGIYDALGRWTTFTYEPAYNLPTSLTDARGNVTTFTYDARGNLIQRKDPLGGVTTYAYNAFGQVTSSTDPKGNKTSFTYDAYGNLASVTDPLGHTTTYTHDVLGRRTRVADALGTIAQFTYDANGQLRSVTDALNRTASSTYTPNGELATVTDPLGKVTTRTYDCFGNVLSATDAKGQVTTFTYDTANQMHLDRANRLTLTDAKSQMTTYTYDALDRLIKTTDAAGNITQLGYDKEGNRTSRIDALGRTTTYTYDALNRLVRITYPDLTTVNYTLDAVSNLTSLVDPTGTTSYTYDANDRLIRKVFPDLKTFDYTYDPNGNRITLAIPGVGTTTYAYDGANRLTQLTAPDGTITRFSYDSRSRRTQLAYPSGLTTTYAYDGANQLGSFTTQSATTLIAQATYTYDAAGRRTQTTFTSGPTTGALTYVYDPLSQLTQETGTVNGQAVNTAYSYDALGNRTQLVSNGMTTTSTYNTLNQLTSESSGAPGTLTVSGTVSDANLASVMVNSIQATLGPGTFTATNVPISPGPNILTATALDNASRSSTHQIQVTYQPDAQTTTYTYDTLGNRTGRSSPSLTETLTYDFDTRLTGFHDGSATTSYAYNGLGERVRNTLPTSPAPSVTFRASPLAISAGQSSTLSWTSTQATTCTASGGWSGAKALNGTDVVSPATSTTYTLSCTGSGGSLTPSLTVLVQDQTYALSPSPMTTAPGGDLTVGWIAPSGRPTSDWIGLYRAGDPSTSYLWWRYTNGAGSGSFTLTAPATPGVYEFRYFLQNGYTEAARSTPVAVEAPSSPSTGTAFYWDGPEVVLETTGSTSTFSLHGPGLDELLSRTTNGTTHYYHQDALGSVVALTDATGTVVKSYAYEPFGTIRKTTGTAVTPWTFTGRPLEPESGLYFLRNRYYDSRTGTFVTQDPIGIQGGINLYAYVRNNPLNLVDPWGLEASSVGNNPVRFKDPFGSERNQANNQAVWVAEAIARLTASEAIGATALGISYAGIQLMRIPHPAARLLGFGLEAIAAGLEAVSIDLLPIPNLNIPIIPDNDPGE